MKVVPIPVCADGRAGYDDICEHGVNSSTNWTENLVRCPTTNPDMTLGQI